LVPSGQDIGEEQHLFVVKGARHFQWADVGLGHPHILRLSSRHTSVEMAVTKECGAGWGLFLVEDGAAAGVGGLAGSVQIHGAEETGAAGDDEWHYHTVAFAYPVHRGAGVDYLAHEFVAEDIAILDLWNLATVQVQIRAADGGGGHPQNDVVVSQHDRIGNGLDTYVMASVISECSHGVILIGRQVLYRGRGRG